MHWFISVAIGLGVALTLTPQVVERPAVLKVFTTRAIATVLSAIGAEFARTTGYTLDITTDIAIRMVRRIQAGESFDVLVAAPDQIGRLIDEGQIIASSRRTLARSGIGIEVRAGAPHPDISSVAAFRRALLNATSIAYLKEGQSGVYLAGLIEQLGLTQAVQAKLMQPDTDIVSELVAKGEVELGMVVITQILTTPGVSLVGPLPAELQSYITFTAGVSTKSMSPAAAKGLIDFLAGPKAISIMRAQGMEPGSVD